MRAFKKIIKRFLQVGCLILIDLVAFYLCLSISWVARAEVVPTILSDLPVFQPYTYYLTFWWIPVIFLFFLFYEGLYVNLFPFWDESRDLVKALSLATVTIMAIITLGKMGDKISRLLLIGTWTWALFLFPLFRLWGKKLLYALGVWRERVLILGAGNAGRLVLEGLQREKHMGYDVVGFLDDDERKKGEFIHGKKVFGRVKYFPRYTRELGIRTVIIAMPSLAADRLSSLTADVQEHALHTMVIPDLKGIALLNTDLLHLFYEELFLMKIRNNLKSMANRAVKRIFDLLFCLALLPLFLPVIGLIAAIIRIETPGPALYPHIRIGKDGRAFRCYKFRTMYRDAEERLKNLLDDNEHLLAEWEKNVKLRDDPRVTKIGSYLRKTSLDELPQLLNVLKGEMTLVGPRPVTHYEMDVHYGEMGAFCFSVPPGITGLWQVSGRSNTTYEYRIKLDAWYIRNWSLWLDIAILFKTLRVVVQMKGAY